MNPSDIFKSLNGKKAKVSAEGLILEGCYEESCTLHYIEYSGLHCLLHIQHNMANVVVGQIEQIIINACPNLITHMQRDELLSSILPDLMKVKVQSGRILEHGITKITIEYNPEIYTIQYENGNCITIRLTNK
jgi:hypothetical protein